MLLLHKACIIITLHCYKQNTALPLPPLDTKLHSSFATIVTVHRTLLPQLLVLLFISLQSNREFFAYLPEYADEMVGPYAIRWRNFKGHYYTAGWVLYSYVRGAWEKGPIWLECEKTWFSHSSHNRSLFPCPLTYNYTVNLFSVNPLLSLTQLTVYSMHILSPLSVFMSLERGSTVYL